MKLAEIILIPVLVVMLIAAALSRAAYNLGRRLAW
jgi:hypothetical protein